VGAAAPLPVGFAEVVHMPLPTGTRNCCSGRGSTGARRLGSGMRRRRKMSRRRRRRRRRRRQRLSQRRRRTEREPAYLPRDWRVEPYSCSLFS
jgi:hypothetical protein